EEFESENIEPQFSNKAKEASKALVGFKSPLLSVEVGHLPIRFAEQKCRLQLVQIETLRRQLFATLEENWGLREQIKKTLNENNELRGLLRTTEQSIQNVLRRVREKFGEWKE